MFLMDVIRLALAFGAACLAGKLVGRLGFPPILGWLVAGMALGPYGAGLMSQELMEASWYTVGESILECTVGLMIGTELVWRRMKEAGSQIAVTTITESLGTFVIVSLAFAAVFSVSGMPLYLSFVLGGIALATAPAPSLSIVSQMKASGPVTRTLLPMAAMDDLVGALVFFTVMGIVSSLVSGIGLPVPAVLLLVFFPVFLGAVLGWAAGKLLLMQPTEGRSLGAAAGMLLLTAGAGFFFNSRVLPVPVLNFLLLGMAFSAVFANMIPERQLDGIMKVMNPVISAALVVLILDLGAPLDYHLIWGAGLYTAVYILSRAVGKYAGAYAGAAATRCPKTVCRYLGLTLLPHSGVSLVFTGIAVSVLSGPAPECAAVIQGTVTAAAVINEVIAVILAKKGFEWAGELPGKEARSA